MLVYHYDPQTHELTGSEEADPDPLTPGAWLVPAHATTVKPPDALPIAGQSIAFDAESQSWKPFDTSWRVASAVVDQLRARLEEVASTYDLYCDLAALDGLDPEERNYLDALRIYRVRLHRVIYQSGFPMNVVWPERPPPRALPKDMEED